MTGGCWLSGYGVLVPPNHTAVHGRAALEDYFRERFSGTRFRFSFTFSDIQLAGDLAFERLAFTALAGPQQAVRRPKTQEDGSTSTDVNQTDRGSSHWIFGTVIH